MEIGKLIEAIIPFIFLFTTSCNSNSNFEIFNNNGGNNEQNIAINSPPNLPITSSHWRDWHCDEIVISTKFKDESKKILILKMKDKEYYLNFHPSNRPAIYENKEYAFFSDGHSALIGKPKSDHVFYSNCRLIR